MSSGWDSQTDSMIASCLQRTKRAPQMRNRELWSLNDHLVSFLTALISPAGATSDCRHEESSRTLGSTVHIYSGAVSLQS